MHLFQGTPGKAALCACFALTSNIYRKVSSGRYLPVIKKQVFVAALVMSSCGNQTKEKSQNHRIVCAVHSVSLLITLLSTDPVLIVVLADGKRIKYTNLFYPGLQSLISLAGEGWDVFLLSSCTVLTKVPMKADQPPEYAAETFTELKWKQTCQKY